MMEIKNKVRQESEIVKDLDYLANEELDLQYFSDRGYEAFKNIEKYIRDNTSLERKIGCPLTVLTKLVLERKVWAETPEMHFEEGNYGSLVGSQKWEDRHWCEVDADFTIDDDNLGDTAFWAWYDYCCNGSDLIRLKLSDHGKLWWLKKDKSE